MTNGSYYTGTFILQTANVLSHHKVRERGCRKGWFRAGLALGAARRAVLGEM